MLMNWKFREVIRDLWGRDDEDFITVSVTLCFMRREWKKGLEGKEGLC